MSLDYPNRNDWLEVRRTPRVLSGRTIWNKGTFSDSRNAEKRSAQAVERIKRTRAVEIHAAEDFPGKAPKRTYGLLRVDVLSDRRLRQRRHGLH